MSEQRYGYTYHRVLIESARVLSPQFSDAVIYVTGAQLEMLRNMTQYLHRLSTYVSDYQPGYYLSPTVEDYDDILAVVADLEDVLMGNPNTIWGYYDRWDENDWREGVGTADVFVDLSTVPEGEVWILEEAYVFHEADTTKELKVYADGGGDYFYLLRFPSASPIIYHRWAGRLVLKEGDHLGAWVVAPGDGKIVEFHVWGSKMKVPTV